MTAVAEEDEPFSELTDATFPRVDLVARAANGTRFLIAKEASGGAGLLAPDFVRDLIAKAPQDTTEGPVTETSTRERAVTPNGITLTGSPADIASFIHKAAIAARERDEDVVKADMSTKSINDLDDDQFAYIEPGGEKDEHGRTVPRSLRHFPLNDAPHVRNALSRAPQSPFGDKAMPKIRAAAKKFGIDSDVKKAADLWPIATVDELRAAIELVRH